jgi:Polyketide cyclase / dehydrase and lipid transport
VSPVPTDHARQTIEIGASYDEVLATLRDIESQSQWIPEILEAELLEVYEDDDLPATARFSASASVGTDHYTLSYEHGDDTMSWSMLEGQMQTGQEGCYRLRRLVPGATEVTYDLTIHHHLPLPGFVRSRVIKGLVDHTLTGLKGHLEA